MEKEFIPYEKALALKELGFDEPCFAFYNNAEANPYIKQDFNDELKEIYTGDFEAPLYQQAFRWFRKKYGKDSLIARCSSTKGYFFDISWRNKKEILKDFQSKDFSTYEEAELECLKKLIEIVKNK